MAEQKNTLFLHGCGGCGINVVNFILPNIKKLGAGYANVVADYIDTSFSNIRSVPGFEKIDVASRRVEKFNKSRDGELSQSEINSGLYNLSDEEKTRGRILLSEQEKQITKKFWSIQKASALKSEIMGSGGNRAHNADDISRNITQYLETRGIKEQVNGEFHGVVFSASGGSGNVIATFLSAALLKMGIPTVLIIVGDASSEQYNMNTMNCIKSLDNVAKRENVAMSTIYVRNDTVSNSDGDTYGGTKVANEYLFSTIGFLCMFLSSTNKELDYQDMANILNQKNLNKDSIPAGLYSIRFFKKDVSIPDGAFATMARSLSIHCDSNGEVEYEGVKYTIDNKNIDVHLVSDKLGFLDPETNPGLIKSYIDQLPLRMITVGNGFKAESDSLHKKKMDFDEYMKRFKQEKLHSHGTTDEDSGLVL